MLSKADCIHMLCWSAVLFRRPSLQKKRWLNKKIIIFIMKTILKRKMEMTWIVLWLNIMTRHNNMKQLNMPEKVKTKSRRIRTTILFSGTVCNIKTLVWSWYWLDWIIFYGKVWKYTHADAIEWVSRNRCYVVSIK